MTRLWSRLFSWLWARWERAGDRWQDACAAIGYDEEDGPAKPVAWVACPECGEEVPITLAPIRMETDEDGQQVMCADLQLDDVWAHAWTHDDPTTDPDHPQE